MLPRSALMETVQRDLGLEVDKEITEKRPSRGFKDKLFSVGRSWPECVEPGTLMLCPTCTPSVRTPRFCTTFVMMGDPLLVSCQHRKLLREAQLKPDS